MTTVVETYKLVFRGELLDGVTVDEARANAARLLKLTDAQVEQVFSGRSVTLKKGLAQPDVTRYRTVLARAGLVVHAEMEQVESAFPTLWMDVEPPAAEVVAPAPAAPAPMLDAEVVPASPSVSSPLTDLPPLLSLDGPPSPAPVALPAESESGLDALCLAPIERPAMALSAAVSQAAPASPSLAVPLPADDEVVCPKCDLRQLKRTICRRCNVDMHNFLKPAPNAATDSSRTPRVPLYERVAEGYGAYETPPLLSLSFNGRIGRLRYLVWGLPIALAGAAALAWILLMGVAAHGNGMGVPLLAWSGAMLLSQLRLAALRLHDLNLPAILMVLVFIPFANIALALYLMLMPGNKGGNQYGPPPGENSFGVYLGFILLMLCWIMIGVSVARIKHPHAQAQHPPESQALDSHNILAFC